jgi:hypothetical protein
MKRLLPRYTWPMFEFGVALAIVVAALAIEPGAFGQPPQGRGGSGANGSAGQAPQGRTGAPAGPPNLGKPPADGKIEIVTVTGCLREQGADNWMLVSATDPLVSVANAPPRSEIPAAPPAGKNQFKLIGVGEFALPTHKDKTVVVKGLYIKAMPVSRLNMTSVVDAVQSCAADAPK